MFEFFINNNDLLHILCYMFCVIYWIFLCYMFCIIVYFLHMCFILIIIFIILFLGSSWTVIWDLTTWRVPMCLTGSIKYNFIIIYLRLWSFAIWGTLLLPVTYFPICTTAGFDDLVPYWTVQAELLYGTILHEECPCV